MASLWPLLEGLIRVFVMDYFYRISHLFIGYKPYTVMSGCKRNCISMIELTSS